MMHEEICCTKHKWTSSVIISFILVRMLADCVGASKYCNISIALGLASEPMRCFHRIAASAYEMCQTQSPSLRIYAKEFVTLLVKSRQSNFNFGGIHFIKGTTLISLTFKHHMSDYFPTGL